MTDLSPSALRALAEDLRLIRAGERAPLWIGADRIPLAATTLRALADEKEAATAADVLCTWPSCGHTARGQCLPLPRTMPVASKIVQAAEEVAAIARGEAPAARIHMNGHAYIPETAARDARRSALEEAAGLCRISPQDLAEGDWGDEGAAMAEMLESRIRALINDTGPSISDELAQARDFIKDYQRQLSEEMVRSSVAEAKLAKVQGALDDLAIRLGDPQRRYNKIGPTWTGKSGHEYSDMSELLDFATEIGEQTAAIRALIDREPAPPTTEGDTR